VNIRSFTAKDTELVVSLWQCCGLLRSWNNPYLDIERKLAVNPEWFVVGEVNHEIVASAMFGYEGHRGWVNYLAASPAHQRQGHAKALMAHGETLLLASGCPKISLQVRASNTPVLAFYQSLGYQDDQADSLGKRLIPDH
jgi:ribosomal protein S18 acetylase RimI-like enzyme